MTVFNCDIVGTFDGNSESDERNRDIINFVDLLVKIMHLLDIEDLPFRFYSSEAMDGVLKKAQELAPFLDGTSIRLTSQYSQDQSYKNGIVINLPLCEQNKVSQIANKIDKNFENNNVERVIYADDSYINQLMTKKIIAAKHPNIEFVSLIPSQDKPILENNTYSSPLRGLKGLNQCLNEYALSLTQEKGTQKR